MSLEQRNRMSEIAWQSAQDFSWQARAAFAKKLYADLLHDKKLSYS
jgi:hypothetical protein